jgi:membrane fusion protein (multidrug efflux system)
MERKKPHAGNIALSIVAVLVVGTGVFYTASYLLRMQKYEETNDAQVEANINPVSARAGGYIKKVWFNEHLPVQAGDTLITIEDREYKARLQEAQAAVDDAHAQLKMLDASVYAAEVATTVNKDQIEGAKARQWQSQQDMNRYRNLVKAEAATGAEFEQVKAHYDVAVSDFNASKSSLTASKARILELKSKTDLLLADLKKKEAQLELARINLSYTVVTAPYSGKLGRKTVLIGQQIQPGQPLVYIINEKEKWVTANFLETQVGGMRIGQAVDVSVDALDGVHYRGTIEAISGSTGSKFSLLPPDNSSGNFVKIVQRIPVKIKLNADDMNAVKVGMNVIVSIEKQKKS